MSCRGNNDLQRGRWLARLATVTFGVLTLVLIVEAAMVAVAPRPAVALPFFIAFRTPAPF